MREEGYRYTCARCGKTAFTTKTTPPHGWSVEPWDLCPTCTDLWNKLTNTFFDPAVKKALDLEGITVRK